MVTSRTECLAALLLFSVGGCGSSEPPAENRPAAGTSREAPRATGTATPPGGRPLVREGQHGRLLLGGRWRFKLDNGDQGIRRRYMAQRSLRRWRPISVSHDWNGADKRFNRSSVGWYRRDFVLPHAAKGTRWIVRFEGAGHASTVYLNGRKIAGHRGNYLPFEADLRRLRHV